MRIYVATRLERIAEARALIALLEEAGHAITYDWTGHGPVYGEGPERVRHVAQFEASGVASADVAIVLLPGGRGTHVELGVALGTRRRVIIFGSAADFECGPGLCAFYLHPLVERVVGTDLRDLVKLLEEPIGVGNGGG